MFLGVYMNDNRKEDLIDHIYFMNETSPEEIRLILFEGLKLLLRSLVIFGIDSIQVKESVNAIKEMGQVLNEERKILKDISSNIHNSNIDEVIEQVSLLDELNIDSYRYYDSILNEICISCDTRNKNRVIRPREGSTNFVSSEEYKKKVKKLHKNYTKKKDD